MSFLDIFGNPENRRDYRDLSPKIHPRLKLASQPKNQGQDQAYQQTADNREVEAAMFAAEGDVAGQPAQAQSREIRPEQSRRHQDNPGDDQEAAHQYGMRLNWPD